MKKKFWTSDKLFAVLAVLISLTTLVIFVKQTNIIDKQSRLSAMPYLTIETSNNSLDQHFRFDLINYGVGPAIIEEIEISCDGKTYPHDLQTFAEEHLPEMDSINVVSSSSVQKGLAIPAEGDRTMLVVGGNKEDYEAFLVLLEDLLENRGLDYRIRYRSIYNEVWEIRNSYDYPVKIED